MGTIGVIGAGLMGSGIAQVSAQAGYHVLLSDIDLARAQAGKDGIAKILGKQVEKGKKPEYFINWAGASPFKTNAVYKF